MWERDAIRRAMLLYAVTDDAWLGDRTLAHCVAEAIEGGTTFVQLREKDMTTAEIVDVAKTIMPLCREAGIPFVIDDDVEAAAASGADGVHVGQSDAACAEARRRLGPDAIIGVSVQTLDQALAAQAAGADYLGVGAMFGTPTKDDAILVSNDTLREICDTVDIPVVAIGGLNRGTIKSLANTGIDGVAVVSAIFAAADIRTAAEELLHEARAVVS